MGAENHHGRPIEGYTLADIVDAKLESHAQEDQRMFQAIAKSIETLSKDVKDINKWIWIATGVMLALSKGIDFIAQKHGL